MIGVILFIVTTDISLHIGYDVLTECTEPKLLSCIDKLTVYMQ